MVEFSEVWLSVPYGLSFCLLGLLNYKDARLNLIKQSEAN